MLPSSLSNMSVPSFSADSSRLTVATNLTLLKRFTRQHRRIRKDLRTRDIRFKYYTALVGEVAHVLWQWHIDPNALKTALTLFHALAFLPAGLLFSIVTEQLNAV
jgi:hypothetical protein